MSNAAIDTNDDYSVYQTSTISALLAGVYDGTVTVSELLAHGDFGLGTFNHLDGEMIVLDGVCYHLRSDGSVTVATGTEHTPFAAVTYFHAKHELAIDTVTTRHALTALIDGTINSANVGASIRISGTFDSVRTRTVGEQKKPYPPLVDAAAGQAENTLTQVTGTIAGYRTPPFEDEISVAGYHLHFIDDSRTRGGHVLDFVLSSGKVEISPISELHLSLPETTEFLDATISTDVAADENQAEGGS
ncbi:alpha-acetolactate decarboxylase [Agreia sp. Leaf335]|uniref:acetolactate decarboxylase n=1 Tax=Agreia sp. Leaf335 TaxID=1736340 RepID=UPI0006F7FF88|nr:MULTISPECIES: acetolactate decarboxylase [Microbacteriaceae]KQR22464.1 alpha-acetolactate decarboxylase [Agreia sp. Leaf335]PPF65455.1 acetolactate decarboxylase [Clavibacter michiganensis]